MSRVARVHDQAAWSDLVVGLFGARGSGKTHKALEYLRQVRPARVLIWDPMDQYGPHARAVPSLAVMLKATAAEAFALRYVPRGTEKELRARFGAFCQIAYERRRLVLIVEELQMVTTPSWAPREWSDCTLRGRHRELAIFGISQRPASVDKNFFSNATHLSTGRLAFPADRRCMAEVLDVPLERVTALTGFQYIARNLATGELTLPEGGQDAAGSQKNTSTPARARRVPIGRGAIG